MKYLSTILFLAAMYWTWGLVTHDRPISEQVHVSIQDELKRIISDYIQQNLPNSQNLRFEKFWTESMDDNKVKATFTYSFEDSNDQVGAARVSIQGYAVLNRAKETSDSLEWSFDELVILNNHVDFHDPMKVSPGDGTPSGG